MKSDIVTLAGRCLIGASALVLVACGNKGPLTLPTPTSQPAAKQPLPATPAEKPADPNNPAASKLQ